MGHGCAWVVFIFLIILVLSPIIMLLDGSGSDGMGYYLLFSALAIWALVAIFKSAGKKDNSASSTGYRSSGTNASTNQTSSSNISSDKDDVLDTAIAVGLAYKTVFSDFEKRDDHTEDSSSDRDDWDNDDMYYLYNDSHDFDDFDRADWDDDW